MSEDEEADLQEREEVASPDIEPPDEREGDQLEVEIEEESEERESEKISEREDETVASGSAGRSPPARRKKSGGKLKTNQRLRRSG